MGHGRNSTVIAVRVPDGVYTRVKVLAEKEGWSVSDWLKSVIIRAASILPDGSIRKHSKRRS
jgi:predicted DNA-binding protein